MPTTAAASAAKLKLTGTQNAARPTPLASTIVENPDAFATSPATAAPRAYPVDCTVATDARELEVFQSVLGNDVEVTRTEHIVSGARRCAYRVCLVEVGAQSKR